jgi:uncharacterized protein with von Willebrand factor type A (vWA) domain
MMGVELDILDPTSISSLTRSGSLSLMLPSEAALLRSSIRSLRWLFLAKKAESKLLCVLFIICCSHSFGGTCI